MNVTIEIYYQSNENQLLRRGFFPLKGRTHEKATADFFRWIQRGMPYGAELEKAICAGEDITESVQNILNKQKENGLL